jgi:hypothetical protein
MKKYFVFLIPAILVPAVLSCQATPLASTQNTPTGSLTIGHSYYPELDEFTVSMTDDPSNREPITANPFLRPFKAHLLIGKW